MIKSDMQLKINEYRELIKYSDSLFWLSIETICKIAELHTDIESEELIRKMMNEKNRLEIEYENNTGNNLLKELKKAIKKDE